MLVHAGAERNVCSTVVSTDTHQTTTNFAETMCKNRQINDIHFKYIWASGRNLMLTSVAHLRKRLS